jgi:hypothetical protein
MSFNLLGLSDALLKAQKKKDTQHFSKKNDSTNIRR